MSGLRILTVILCALFLASCTATAAPVQVASFPILTPIAKYPPDAMLYRQYLEIVVPNVDRAAESAAARASVYGGYLVSSSSWYAEGGKLISLELAVPTDNFEYLRSDLKGLGQVINENLTGQPANPGPAEVYPLYSQITLQLRPITPIFPPAPIDPLSWHPVQTLQRAFAVFLTIFGFLLDILIWALVVGGPFLLIGLGIGFVVRKRRAGQATLPEAEHREIE